MRSEVLAPVGELGLPRRGKSLNDAVLIRLIALDRAVHALLFGLLFVVLVVVEVRLPGLKEAAADLQERIAPTVAQTGQHGVLQSPTALRVFAWIFYGIYFVWFWSRRGQTLAMQTWRIGLVTAAGQRPSQARALARYVACCIAWFAPSTAATFALGLPPATALALAAAWVAVYALSARAAPGRQFWHDLACGTRLVDTRAGD